MVVEILKVKDRLKLDLNDLITRPIGVKFYKEVKKLINKINTNEIVLMNFEGVNVADPSFLDEFIVKIILESRGKNRSYYIKLANFNEISSMNLRSVFDSYYNFKNERLAVATDEIINNEKYCIGSVDEREILIMNYLHINKSGSISNIAEFIEQDLENTKNLLEGLYEMRLVRKDENDDQKYWGI